MHAKLNRSLVSNVTVMVYIFKSDGESGRFIVFIAVFRGNKTSQKHVFWFSNFLHHFCNSLSHRNILLLTMSLCKFDVKNTRALEKLSRGIKHTNHDVTFLFVRTGPNKWLYFIWIYLFVNILQVNKVIKFGTSTFKQNFISHEYMRWCSELKSEAVVRLTVL